MGNGSWVQIPSGSGRHTPIIATVLQRKSSTKNALRKYPPSEFLTVFGNVKHKSDFFVSNSSGECGCILIGKVLRTYQLELIYQ